jgi:methionyl-tRNA synthetase
LYNLEGRQFSKSRNWAVWVKDVLKDFSADSVRHYLIANGPESSDADFRWADFQSRHNSDLVGTWGNFANRVYALINKNFANKIPPAELAPEDKFILDLIDKTFMATGKLIESAKLREAERTALELVAAGNRYINEQQPWKTLKTDAARAGTVLNVCAQIAANSARLLEPFMPIGANQLSLLYGVPDLRWHAATLDAGQSLAAEAPLLYQPILDEQIEWQKSKLVQ